MNDCFRSKVLIRTQDHHDLICFVNDVFLCFLLSSVLEQVRKYRSTISKALSLLDALAF